MLAIANVALGSRVHEPLFYDSDGYLRAARDIGAHGVLSPFDLSSLRTYGYPLVLSWIDKIAALSGIPIRVAVTELQVSMYILAGLLLRRAASVYPNGSLAIDIAMYLNVWAVFLSTEVLTESLSLSLLLVVAGCWFWAWQNIWNRKYWLFLSAGSLLVGFCVMLRPANIFMFVAWFAGHLLLIFNSGERGFRARMRSAFLSSAVTLALALLPMLPQLRNNVLYYGRWTPLVTEQLQNAQLTLGVFYIKYGTSVPPAPLGAIQYLNPLVAGTRPPGPHPGAWYLEHPVRGAATFGLHVFNIVDQDFPFVYVQNLIPWYRLPEAVVLHLFTGLSLLGLFVWLKNFPRGNPRETRAAITPRAAFLFAAGGYIAVYGVSAAESRFGVPLLWSVLPFSFVAIQELLAAEGKRRWIQLLGVLVYAVLAVRLSIWVTAQSPQIALACHAVRSAPR